MSFSAKNHCGAYAPCTRACRSTKSASDLAAVVRFRSHADGAICYARFATSSRSSVNSSAHSAASRTELASVTAQSYSQEKVVEGGIHARTSLVLRTSPFCYASIFAAVSSSYCASIATPASRGSCCRKLDGRSLVQPLGIIEQVHHRHAIH